MTLKVARSGTGRDLVLLHGWSMDGTIWGPFADDLSRDFRVHAIDLPGHGASERAAPITLDAMAEAVAGVLPRDCLLCGWSLGGLVALQLAARLGEAVRGLVLIAATPRFCAGDGWPHGIPVDALDAFADELEADPPTLMARFRASMCRGDADERRLRKTLAALPPPPHDRRALHEGLAILREADLRPAAACISAPALLMHGEADNVITPDAARWLAVHLPRATLHEFAACSHLPFLSRTQACAALVRQFARDVQPDL